MLPRNQPKNMRKSVSFGANNLATFVQPTIEEKNLLWYSKSELSSMRRETVKFVLANKDTWRYEDVCLRGLELYFKKDYNRNHRREFVRTILTVQDEMKAIDMEDPRRLRVLASTQSQRDCWDARERAMKDAMEVGTNPEKLIFRSRVRSMPRHTPQRETTGAIAA